MRNIKAWILLVIGLVFSVSATAQGLQGQMDQMFGQMTAVTRPQVVNGAQRGVVTGGSLAIRSPIVNTGNTVNFSPPGVTAGCGGIDLYGGSFSYVSGQQFVQMLRSIASNAEGLAFQMALEAMSNQLSQNLTSLSDKMLQNVLQMKNSCQIAQSALNSTGASNAISSFGNQIGEGIGTFTGQFSDSSQAEQSNTPQNPIVKQVANTNSAEMNQLFYGNLVWQAISTNPTAQTFSIGAGGSALNQEMMSITGTIIVCQPGVDPNCAPSTAGASTITSNSGFNVIFIAPTIHLQDLLWGTTGDNGSSTGAQYLHCDSGDRCMSPKATTWTFPGYATTVANMLGTSSTSGEATGSGIVNDLMQGNTPSPQEMGFLSVAGNTGALLTKVYTHNPNGLAGFAQHISQPLALEMAYQHGMAVINMVSGALKNVQSPGKDDLIKDINNVREQWVHDYQNLKDQQAFDVNAEQLAKVYLDNSENYNLFAPQNVGNQ